MPSQTWMVEIKNHAFNPKNTSINVGDTVQWTNRDAMGHTVTADDGSFDSGIMAATDPPYSWQFNSAGSVPYHCDVHPGMKGAVTVSANIRIASTGIVSVYDENLGRHFWYEFDRATLYNTTFMKTVLAPSGAGTIQNQFAKSRREGTYPDSFLRSAQPTLSLWRKISEVQKTVITNILADNLAFFQKAMEDFAQGFLLDTHPERVANNDVVHMMDGNTSDEVVGFHRWHASIRAIQLLGIGDVQWWEEVDKIVALGWAVQSFAQPKQQNVSNPRIANQDLTRLTNAWIGLSPAQRDRQYDLTQAAVGYHPSPMSPVV